MDIGYLDVVGLWGDDTYRTIDNTKSLISNNNPNFNSNLFRDEQDI